MPPTVQLLLRSLRLCTNAPLIFIALSEYPFLLCLYTLLTMKFNTTDQNCRSACTKERTDTTCSCRHLVRRRLTGLVLQSLCYFIFHWI